ncbi:Mur ligase family protein [Thioalkalivibrio thiocyanodenitrificans]|uniref:Mur ligase family protein n=1 Tax=Thioalkalivibrio thiocyanodenitrificans TaxID=243063 RepID=UPI0003A0C168|nr:Mur ligase family protein [Thioalkalivibrio thiocyanodenitrificans]
MRIESASAQAPPLVEILETWTICGYLHEFDVPGIHFGLRIRRGDRADCAALRERILRDLRAQSRLFDKTPDMEFSPNPDERIGQQFGELVLLFQRAVDAEVSHAKVVAGHDSGRLAVLIEKEDTETAVRAGEIVARLMNMAALGGRLDETWLNDELEGFFNYAAERILDDNARLVLDAARRQGLPALDIDQPPFDATRKGFTVRHGLVQVGMCARQQRFFSSMPQAYAARVAPWMYKRDAIMRRLQARGIPIPAQELEFPNKNRFGRVLRAARQIGFPVVLKSPESGAFHDVLPGSGVIGPIRDADELEKAFACGFGSPRSAWVESYVAGATYRFLVIDSRVVSVARRRAPGVVGDGRSTVRSLVERECAGSASFRERLAWRRVLEIRSTACRLSLAGMTLDSVPDAGVPVQIDFDGCAGIGAWGDEVLDVVPADFHRVALEAVAACGLDYAGVDMVINEFGGGAVYPNAAVISVRAEPDLLIHDRPGTGPARDAAGLLVGKHFSSRQEAVVPIVAVTGTNGKTTTSRMIASLFRHAGRSTGLACSDGIYVDDRLLLSHDLAGAPGSLILHAESGVETLVLETARGGLIRLGRPFEIADVGVCLNVAADHLGHDGIRTLDEMALAKRCVIENTKGTAVLNAEDPRCVAMARYSPARDLILFSATPGSPRIDEQISSGGKAVHVLEHEGAEHIFYFNGARNLPVVAVSEVPATFNGRARHNVENAAAAIAAACASGLPITEIGAGMKRFRMGFETTPSRLNELPGLPYRVIMDAAHNLHGMAALMHYLDQEAVEGRRILVFSASARFPESYVREMARLVAARFDRFICKKYREQEPYHDSEDPWLILRDELLRNHVAADAVSVVPDPKEAIAAAVDMAGPGDLVVLLVPAGNSLEPGFWQELERVTGLKAAV